MNRDQIIKLARDAGAYPKPGSAKAIMFLPSQLEAFYAAIRAATKEEDARICDSKADEDLYGPFWNSSAGRAANICAQAIRDSK